VTTWEYVEHTVPWTDARLTPMLASRQTGIKPDENGIALGGGDASPYVFPSRKVTAATMPWIMSPNPLRTANLRAPYSQARCLAAEAQMDDMAAAAGIDPIEFRLRHLTGSNNERVAAVLRAVAKQAAWEPRRSGADRTRSASATRSAMARGRGVAISGLAGTVVAQIADVEVNRSTGKVQVKKVSVAHDCGIIVNPDGVRNQIEGNVIQGCSRALMEEVSFDAAGVKNLNWSTYPILRFNEVPDVEIVLINHPELPPMGAGEASTTATAAAIGNAIFDAVGVRLRQVPFTQERVRSEMEALKSGKI
jgi:CO/xanthine dehydrogenase Mo-binding subunit